ncbi:hypothetical protein [Marinobacterium lutimaris]|uniref:Uncharacterized protein n=1 Tax=Marinobacterium lutimaris TaxID=568106 RepID=A0A1H5YDA6_9GAMM|nr:hypothetical protein [Marinobacterium lutimaris]SEG21752.1 hypothetical protein SAMN05444390_1011705 [Marinobacterium lutimaris]
MSKIYYKMTLAPAEEGMTITTKKFVSIHETPCFHYCVLERDRGFAELVINGKQYSGTPLTRLKKCHIRVFRIDKVNSRIAFPTEQKAYEHLLFLKRKHIANMKRDMALVTAFLEESEGKQLDDFEKNDWGWPYAPGTQDLVHQHYAFD